MKGRSVWNKNIKLSEEHVKTIKDGINNHKKLCDGCNMSFDSANYTKWHGKKCLIGSIKTYLPKIKELYKQNYNINQIAKMLNIKYKAIYKLKENNLL